MASVRASGEHEWRKGGGNKGGGEGVGREGGVEMFLGFDIIMFTATTLGIMNGNARVSWMIHADQFRRVFTYALQIT